jgi:DNA-binding response OmpR family regulator
MNILIIEPDAILASNCARFLSLANHSVQCLSDAQSAIYAIDNQKPELIILELQLPIHNGIEFLYELRTYPEWQNIPVIVLTQISLDRIAQVQPALNQLRVGDILYKPKTKLADLLSVVSHNLQLSKI